VVITPDSPALPATKGFINHFTTFGSTVGAMPAGVSSDTRHLLGSTLSSHWQVSSSYEVKIMPNFQEFDRQDSHVVPDAPMFTLQTRGTLSLNLAAFKALGEPAAVVLLYDPEEGIIALRKVPRTHHNGYPVRKQGNSRSYLVAATGFASYHKIKTDVSRRYIGRDYGDQTWGFAVADGVVLKHRPRPPKASVHDIREGTGTHGGPANR